MNKKERYRLLDIIRGLSIIDIFMIGAEKLLSFLSYDYYPLFPWFLLYICGYFLYRIFDNLNLMRYLYKPKIPLIEFVGRHSLIIYMLHQPIIYAIQYLIFL